MSDVDDDYVEPQDAIPDFRTQPKPESAEPGEDDDYYDPQNVEVIVTQRRESEVKIVNGERSGYEDVTLKFSPKKKSSLADQMRRISMHGDAQAPSTNAAPKIPVVANPAMEDTYADLSGAVEKFEDGQTRESVLASVKAQARQREAQLSGSDTHTDTPPPPAPKKNTLNNSFMRLPTVPGRPSLPKFRMKQEQFVHGPMTREQADTLLQKSQPGTFLIRVSLRQRHPKFNYILCSYKCHIEEVSKLNIAHCPIGVTDLPDGTHTFFIPAVESKRQFPSLEALVHYYDETNPMLKLVHPLEPK